MTLVNGGLYIQLLGVHLSSWLILNYKLVINLSSKSNLRSSFCCLLTDAGKSYIWSSKFLQNEDHTRRFRFVELWGFHGIIGWFVCRLQISNVLLEFISLKKHTLTIIKPNISWNISFACQEVESSLTLMITVRTDPLSNLHADRNALWHTYMCARPWSIHPSFHWLYRFSGPIRSYWTEHDG